MSELAGFQREVGWWSCATFPQSTGLSVTRHLLRESVELERAVEQETVAHVEEEAADVFLLLLGLCHRYGIDLMDAARDKFAVIRMRQWGEPNAEGFQEHVREEEAHA